MNVKREDAIEAELARRVRMLGGICEKVTVIGRRGFFDRLVVLPGGRVIFAELKRPKGGRVSPHQRQRHAKYKLLGAVVALIRNGEDIDRLLSSP